MLRSDAGMVLTRCTIASRKDSSFTPPGSSIGSAISGSHTLPSEFLAGEGPLDIGGSAAGEGGHGPLKRVMIGLATTGCLTLQKCRRGTSAARDHPVSLGASRT